MPCFQAISLHLSHIPPVHILFMIFTSHLLQILFNFPCICIVFTFQLLNNYCHNSLCVSGITISYLFSHCLWKSLVSFIRWGNRGPERWSVLSLKSVLLTTNPGASSNPGSSDINTNRLQRGQNKIQCVAMFCKRAMYKATYSVSHKLCQNSLLASLDSVRTKIFWVKSAILRCGKPWKCVILFSEVHFSADCKFCSPQDKLGKAWISSLNKSILWSLSRLLYSMLPLKTSSQWKMMHRN